MSLLADLKILYHLALAPVKGATHAERLESFYRGQAGAYDSFRKRLLQGREDLWKHLPASPGGRWIDMGAGTGSNLEYFGERLQTLSRVFLVDLSPSLLAVARQRIAEKKWENVEAVEADATVFQPPGGPVDVVTFSYSLTMIPDWFAAIDQAWRLLKPGGHVGVVDFFVSRKHPETGRAHHPWFTRTFWPTWFAQDNVFLSPDHLPYLSNRFLPERLAERQSRVPYLPLRVPYYVFVGRKPL